MISLPPTPHPPPSLSSGEDLYPGRPYGALDSGFNSVDSGDKRWSGNEVRHTLTVNKYRMTDEELSSISAVAIQELVLI